MTADIAWMHEPRSDAPVTGTVAWLVSLAPGDPGATADLAPSPADLQDVGARGGAERRRFLARRALLRHLIARRLGIEAREVVVQYGDHGRPRLAAPSADLFCSVAARGDAVGLALSSGPVGIDLEPVTDGPLPWPVLSAAEATRLLQLPHPDRLPAFLGIWTVKEAYLKATGTGLLVDPASLSVTLGGVIPLIEERGRPVPLAAGQVRLAQVGGVPVTAACIALARPLS